MEFLEKLLATVNIGIGCDERTSARRRRIEWPTEDQAVWDALRSQGYGATEEPPSPLSGSAEALVKGELAVCDTRTGYIHDIGVFDQVYVKNPDYRQILRNLYWRARRQSTIWDVFNLLVLAGLIDVECLQVPVNLMNVTKKTGAVTWLLGCYSRFDRDCDLAAQGKIPLELASPWRADAEWLATMMIRSKAPFDKQFERISACRLLGEMDVEAASEAMECIDLNFEWDSHERERKPGDTLLPDGTFNKGCNQFGFWLPHGLSTDPVQFGLEVRECTERFNRIEAAFRESEGLSQEQLWLESEQVEFFEKYPEKLPGANNDYPDEVIEMPPPGSE